MTAHCSLQSEKWHHQQLLDSSQFHLQHWHENLLYNLKNLDALSLHELSRFHRDNQYSTQKSIHKQRRILKTSRHTSRCLEHKIDDYFQNLFNPEPSKSVITGANKQKSFYKDLVQIGTKDNIGVGTPDAEIAIACLREYMEDFRRAIKTSTFITLSCISMKQIRTCTSIISMSVTMTEVLIPGMPLRKLSMQKRTRSKVSLPRSMQSVKSLTSRSSRR